MKIFNKLYVGIKLNYLGDSDIPVNLAFITPYAENSAGRKRQQSVKDWVYDNRNKFYDDFHDDDKHSLEIIENTAQLGFKIVESIHRQSSGNRLIRIADPRGFQAEISTANLVELCLTANIENGTIRPACVWLRAGADNWLVSIDSAEYNNALREGETKTANPNDIVVDYAGREYVYLGKKYIRAAIIDRYRDYDEENNIFINSHKCGEIWNVGERHCYVVINSRPRYHLAANSIRTLTTQMKIEGIVGKSDKDYDLHLFETDERLLHSAGRPPKGFATNMCQVNSVPFDNIKVDQKMLDDLTINS